MSASFFTTPLLSMSGSRRASFSSCSSARFSFVFGSYGCGESFGGGTFESSTSVLVWYSKTCKTRGVGYQSLEATAEP